MTNGMEIAKQISNFKKELAAKLDESKGINYKTVVKFIQEVNTLLGKEVVKCEVSEKFKKHNYKVANRLRYNDTYKSGVNITIDFLGNKYTAHTSDQYQAFNLANFMSNQLVNPIKTALALGNAIK